MLRRPWLLFGLLLVLAALLFASGELLLYLRGHSHAVSQLSDEADLKAAHEADMAANREIGEDLNATASRGLDLEARANDLRAASQTASLAAAADFLAIEAAAAKLTQRLADRPETNP